MSFRADLRRIRYPSDTRGPERSTLDQPHRRPCCHRLRPRRRTTASAFDEPRTLFLLFDWVTERLWQVLAVVQADGADGLPGDHRLRLSAARRWLAWCSTRSRGDRGAGAVLLSGTWAAPSGCSRGIEGLVLELPASSRSTPACWSGSGLDLAQHRVRGAGPRGQLSVDAPELLTSNRPCGTRHGDWWRWPRRPRSRLPMAAPMHQVDYKSLCECYGEIGRAGGTGSRPRPR